VERDSWSSAFEAESLADLGGTKCPIMKRPAALVDAGVSMNHHVAPCLL